MEEKIDKSIRIVVIPDGLFGICEGDSFYLNDLTFILLQRLVMRLNRLVKPQVTIFTGGPNREYVLKNRNVKWNKIQSILEKLESTCIFLPAEFNADSESFYKVYPHPTSTSASDTNIISEAASLGERSRIKIIRDNHAGPVLEIQQNKTNKSSQIHRLLRVKENDEVFISVSSLNRSTSEILKKKDMPFVDLSDISKPPFPYTVLDIGNENIGIEEQYLSMDKKLCLRDNHLHTQLAFCNDDIQVSEALRLAYDFGLFGLTFTEHSGQLYFDNNRYWDKSCLKEGMENTRKTDNRMADYLELKQSFQQAGVSFGLEVDCDYKGRLLLHKKDLLNFDFIIGAMHGLPDIFPGNAPDKKNSENFLFILEKLLSHNIDVLAHPFRVFGRSGLGVPEELFPQVAVLLRKYKTAAEINFHTNEPPVEFIRICLNQGVKFSLGSDAHQMAEIGDFAYHLALLNEAGFDGDLSDVLIPCNQLS